MLNEILLREEINLIAVKHTNALKDFALIFNAEMPKKRFKFLIPLKQAGFSLSEVKQLNFKAGGKIWKNCNNDKPRNKGGRPKVKMIITKNINDYMKTVSEIAANRYLIKLKRNARYRHGTFKAAFNNYKWKKSFGKKITFSTFYKKICKRFKKPHRLSDLCDICENGKVSEKK